MEQGEGRDLVVRFVGEGAVRARRRLMTWLLDGGGEDQLLDELELGGVTSDGIDAFDLEEGWVRIPVAGGAAPDGDPV